jgi:hypothetical protein
MLSRGPSTCSRVVATGALTSLAFGCAQLLGGLDEGTARPRASEAGTENRCSDWLDRFGYRTSFHVRNEEAATLQGYSVQLSLDTKSAVLAGKMRSDGADLRITSAQGVLAPHWIQSGMSGEATRIWTKVDLSPGDNIFFAYYGNPSATDRGSIRDTFVDGVLANPRFEQGTAPWFSERTGNEATTTMEMSNGVAHIAASRGASTSREAVGWCQIVELPPGRSYRIVLDATVRHVDQARPTIWAGGLAGTLVWSAPGWGELRGIETSPIPGGRTELCLGGVLDSIAGEQGFNVDYANLRLRVDAPSNPLASAAGSEETACPR